MELDKQVFSGKNVSDLLQEIYDRQKEQDTTLKEKLGLLSSYIETPGDAIVMMPLIKDLMDTGVRNNEVLLKMVQLFKQSSEQKASGESGNLTQKDIDDLFNDLPPSAFSGQQKLIK